MEKDNIFYTGVGARKSGNHTKKQYLQVMDKHFKKDCSVYTKSLKCKSCEKSIKMSTKEIKKQLKAHFKNKTYKMTTKTEKKIVKQMDLCKKCKNNKTKKCDFDEYIDFSGAEPEK
jgi:hypothetical protein